jgi:RNA polymerase sigma-70 factor (ECF subfamily)
MSRENENGPREFQEWAQPLLSQAAGYAYSLVGNRADAEDAVQEALWKGYRGLAHYDRARPFKGWWFAIVRHCCLDLIAKRRAAPRTVPVEMAHSLPAKTASDAEPLREAIAQMPPLLREILELRYFGGCSYHDLSEALNIPIGTVMSRLHAARLALAAIYRKD